MRLLLALIISLCFLSAQAAEPSTKPVIKKAKLLRSNPHRLTSILIAGNNPWAEVDDEDILPQRRYRFELKDDDTELSDYVQFRLWLARQLAMKKFAKTHSDLV